MEYDFFVSQFIEKLVQTRDNFMLARRNGRSSRDLPEGLFGRTTDTIAILRILSYDKKIRVEVKEEEDTQRRNRRGRRARTAEPDEQSQTGEADADPLLYESDWIDTQFGLSPQLVCQAEIAETLYNALGLYVRSHPHKEATLKRVLATIQKVHEYAIANPIRGNRSTITAFNECQKRIKHALEIVAPTENRQQIPTIHEEDEENLSRDGTVATVEQNEEEAPPIEPSAIMDATIKSEPNVENCGEFSTLQENTENEPPVDHDTSSKIENETSSDLNGTLVEGP
uniref:NR LBD domain-containing protein n=1 Tax=Bursaphelenchus xylophilus TaxID=6326 RepID=A0A1I7RMM9_BURXY